MDTTAAAAQAGVTVTTIRSWCRYGAITAAKTAGRWIIDAASLAARIRIAKERHMAKTAAPTWGCGHPIDVITLRVRGVDEAAADCGQRDCSNCFEAQRQRRADAHREALATAFERHGELATPRQVDYLTNLIQQAEQLPADCPTGRHELQLLPRAAASDLIDTLKAARRRGPARPRRYADCECPSGRYGGICTCC